MIYTVRVSDNLNPDENYEDKTFEEVSDDQDKLDKNEEKARKEFHAAVGKYNSSHTVWLFRDGVSLGNRLGTGSGVLESK